jgi:hypothetical protein
MMSLWRKRKKGSNEADAVKQALVAMAKRRLSHAESENVDLVASFVRYQRLEQPGVTWLTRK